ncbi:hypothetical protein NDU88_003039 [Pleurodeles waltl]|uniref:Secreted protein n=1 Tax=Pleurodeles waltl TaxID=8319 RepID=A0AAV7UXC0_PLEWA|nr:hypothetical protein NDU88_003039 [Pleurodeles waltl]
MGSWGSWGCSGPVTAALLLPAHLLACSPRLPSRLPSRLLLPAKAHQHVQRLPQLSSLPIGVGMYATPSLMVPALPLAGSTPSVSLVVSCSGSRSSRCVASQLSVESNASRSRSDRNPTR